MTLNILLREEQDYLSITQGSRGLFEISVWQAKKKKKSVTFSDFSLVRQEGGDNFLSIHWQNKDRGKHLLPAFLY